MAGEHESKSLLQNGGDHHGKEKSIFAVAPPILASTTPSKVLQTRGGEVVMATSSKP